MANSWFRFFDVTNNRPNEQVIKQTKWLLHSKKNFKTQTTEVWLNQTFWRPCFAFHLLILDGANFIIFYVFKSYYSFRIYNSIIWNILWSTFFWLLIWSEILYHQMRKQIFLAFGYDPFKRVLCFWTIISNRFRNWLYIFSAYSQIRNLKEYIQPQIAQHKNEGIFWRIWKTYVWF